MKKLILTVLLTTEIWSMAFILFNIMNHSPLVYDNDTVLSLFLPPKIREIEKKRNESSRGEGEFIFI